MPGYEETERAERLEDRADDLRAELDRVLEAADKVVKSCYPGRVDGLLRSGSLIVPPEVALAIGALKAAIDTARKNRDA